MAWTSWSQTWSTKCTTTTSRRPLKRRCKHMRWRRTYSLFASQSKAKAKNKKTYLCVLIYKNCTYSWKKMDWYWTRSPVQSSVPSCTKTKHSSSAWTIPREEDGAIEFWRLKMIFGTNWSTLDICLMICGRARWQEVEATRKDFNIVLTRQDQKLFYLQALQGHSGRNPIDRSLQDNVCLFQTLSSSTFIMLDVQISVHTITNSGLIARG